jgi:hypothetical protein
MKCVTKLAIVASRSFNNYDLLKDVVLQHVNLATLREIVSGGAKGADTLATRFAKEFNLRLITFLPDWERHGRSAGIIRNRDIVNYADFVLAFSVNNSRGTNSVITYCQRINKPIHPIHLTEDSSTNETQRNVE